MKWKDVTVEPPEVGSLCVAWLQERNEPACCRIEADRHGLIWRELVAVDVWDDREDVIRYWLPIEAPQNNA